MEPVIWLGLPGVAAWAVLTLGCCCFCYRRYRLGLCGEPIPTKTAYTPFEITLAMSVAATSFGLLLLFDAHQAVEELKQPLLHTAPEAD